MPTAIQGEDTQKSSHGGNNSWGLLHLRRFWNKCRFCYELDVGYNGHYVGHWMEAWQPVQWIVMFSFWMCDPRSCAGLSSYDSFKDTWAGGRGGQLYNRKRGIFPTSTLICRAHDQSELKNTDLCSTVFSFLSCCSGKAVINSGGVCLSKNSPESKIFCRE